MRYLCRLGNSNYANSLLSLLFWILLSGPIFSQNTNEEIGKRLNSIYGYSETDFKRSILEAEKLLANIDNYDDYFDKAIILTVVANIQVSDNRIDEALKNVRKAIDLIEGKDHDKLYSQAKFVLANAYVYSYQYEKAFPVFNELIRNDDYGSEENRNFLYVIIRKNFGELNEKIGRNREALRLNLQADSIKVSSNLVPPAFKQALAIQIANLYNSFGQRDSANLYINRYHENVKKNGESLAKNFLPWYEGNSHFYAGNFDKAIPQYREAEYLLKKDFNGDDDDLLLKKSRSHFEVGQFDSVLTNLAKITNHKDFSKKEPFLNPEYYKLFSEVYEKKGDQALSKKFLGDYIVAQERYNSFKFNTLDELYGLDAQEINAKDRSEKKYLRDYINYLWIALLGLLVIGVLLFVIKQKRNQKKFKRLMQRTNTASTKVWDESKTSQNLTIKDEKVAEIIKQIDVLNEEGFFLKQKTTLYNTVKKLQTNTSYLSNVINNHLNTTFNSFVNEIRINYIVNELKNNRQIRSYSVKAISEEIGYKSADSFTKYFKQNTGLSPSQFIRKIQKEY